MSYRNIIKTVLVFSLIFSLVTTPVFAQLGTTQSGQDDISSNEKDNNSVTNLSENEDSKKFNKLEKKLTGVGQMSGAGATQQISVHILGDVQSPGVYNTIVSDRAADVVKMAGINRNSLRVIQIRHPGDKTRYIDLYQYYYFGNLSQNPFLQDNDVIFVPVQSGSVRIEGPVKRPGTYELFGEKYLSQIVQLAGGFTSALSKINPIKIIRFTDGGEKTVLDVDQSKASLSRFQLQKGDIYIIPDVINSSKEFDYSVESIPGENLIYPTSVPDVFVIGAVSKPGPYPYKSHLTIKDYVGFAGANASANFRSVRVLRNGKKVRKSLYAKTQAGDVVIVREKALNGFVSYLTIVSTVISVTLSAFVLRDVLKNP